MSDEGEKTCPLCAEEMDLTDQQLKPCRCGYEVCVWCWHHIMEMAEKDGTEGRCPACRTPYDKERIVGMASSCERLVAEVSMEKKHKSQKAKTKTTEGRKQLTNVRVIQRNLVYIVGLPLNLADEDLLQRREYFGQYGKVLKVSISRTSAGTIQQFANNTCSVYITYAREDEAVRCIQSVHAYILDGRPLRACFGTTKYCHAWLRNVPCSNPDCLYLHEIGSQQDSFTKDEIISAYSRVHQITGVTNNMQRRAGTVLPPPADGYCVSSSAVTVKPVPPVVKSSSNNPDNSTRTSPPTSSCGRPGGLPPAASWGARASNSNAPAASVACSNGPTKQRAETIQGPAVSAASVCGSSLTSTLPDDSGKRLLIDEDIQARESKSETEISDNVKLQERITSHLNAAVASCTPLAAPAVKLISQPTSNIDGDGGAGHLLLNKALPIDERPCSPCEDERGLSTTDGMIQKICGGVSSITIDRPPSGDIMFNGMNLDTYVAPSNHGVQWHECKELQERSMSAIASKESGPASSLTASGEECGVNLDVQAPSLMQSLTSETEDDFANQRPRDAIINQGVVPALSSFHILSHLRGPFQAEVAAGCTGNYFVNAPIVNRIPDEGLAVNQLTSTDASNGFFEQFVNRAPGQENSLLNDRHGTLFGRCDGGLSSFDSQSASDVGENHIISNILSLDLDSWDDSLTSPQTLSKLLGDPDKLEGPVKAASSSSQFNNQSRFSFARQEDSRSDLFDVEPSLGSIGQSVNNPCFTQGGSENKDLYLERQGNGFGFPQRNVEFSDNLLSGHPAGKFSGSRSQISAPPGFSVPSRPPPPGFTSHERSDQTFEFLKSGSQLHESSSYLSNPHYVSPSGNMNTTNDIEFMDPAILAIGKGRLPSGNNSPGIDMRPRFAVQAPGCENDSKLNLLLQRSLTPHHNLRYTDVRDSFSPPNGTYGSNSWHMEQSQANHLSHFSQVSLQQPRTTAVSNGHWDGLSANHATNSVDIAELLRNDRLGFNKFLGGYEDSKFRMTNSGDLYSRSFGM